MIPIQFAIAYAAATPRAPYESPSTVLLEAWNRAVPALVTAHCSVRRGQVRRANGGLFYRSQREFSEALTYLLSHEPQRVALGRQGQAYIEQEYRWPTVMARVETLLAQARLRTQVRAKAGL